MVNMLDCIIVVGIDAHGFMAGDRVFAGLN